MALSPAQQARQRALARQQATASPYGESVSSSAHHLVLAQLVEHRRRLKDIMSVERKIAAKRAFLPDYDAWIDGTLQGHGAPGGQDPVITTLLVWHIDCGNYARALQIAEYAVEHQLDLPDHYERTLPVALIDEFSTAYLGGRMSEQATDILLNVLALTASADAPDQARAKLHKAVGYSLIGKQASASDIDVDKVPVEDLRAALVQLERAYELFDQVGVKKDIERIARRLRKSTNPEPDAQGTPTGGP